jgi:hypothetical protein
MMRCTSGIGLPLFFPYPLDHNGAGVGAGRSGKS